MFVRPILFVFLVSSGHATSQIAPAAGPTLQQALIQARYPRFAAALCDIMHPDVYAVEAGPYAARFVNSLLGNPNRLAIMAERNKAFPNNMAFPECPERR
jgi:hypothetical protein